ncbi:hypothetical protein BFJ67_g17326 [Fusarium oxysporum f. sp. cepae]|nr:hypothetical protein BFJ67_g17326 [Fusarium oxysporum f. sp. cepae]
MPASILLDKQGTMSDDAVFSRVNLSIDVHARVLICCHDHFRPVLSLKETHCVSRTMLMKSENLKHETRRISVG